LQCFYGMGECNYFFPSRYNARGTFKKIL